VQRQPERASRRDCLVVPANAGGADCTPVVLQVGWIEVATPMVLHAACAGRPGYGSAKRQAL
jgi:hypothetical protein